MYDRSERIRRVLLRAEQLQSKREIKQISGLTSLSAFLLLSLIGLIGSMANHSQTEMLISLSGAIMLYENAGSYVFVAVLSFSVAVFGTVFFIKYAKKREKGF